MRDAPQGIRSVILEATIPPIAPEWRLTNYDRALRVLFDACTADPECAAAYPDLERRFYAMLDDLEEDPLILTTEHQSAFADLAVRNASGLSRGLYLSVECYERAPYLTTEAAEADAERAPRLAAHGDLIRTTLDECDAWHEFRASPEELEAVVSQIPTLILAGAFDPITPPETACNEARAPMKFITDVHVSPGIYRAATALRSGPSPLIVGWLGLTVLTLLSGLLGWPLGRLVRRLRQRPLYAGGSGVPELGRLSGVLAPAQSRATSGAGSGVGSEV